MVQASSVEFLPCFFTDEHNEKKETCKDCKPTHRCQPRAEADGTLEVDTEGHEYAVCAECTVNPTEAERHADYYPCDETEY